MENRCLVDAYASEAVMKDTRNILQIADNLIHGEKRDAYGPVKESFARVADMWSNIIGVSITSVTVAQCMIALKQCREMNRHDMDNLVDIAGYAALIEELQ